MRARYYDSGNGRFNRLDDFPGSTTDSQSLHKYLHANGNPILFSDPTGLFSAIGVSSASSIGASLNSLSGELGSIGIETAHGIRRASGSHANVPVVRAGGDLARGHLIGRELGGTGLDAANLAPMWQSNVNNSAFRRVESAVKKRVLARETIDYAVIPIYRSSDAVPAGFAIQARGNRGFYINESVVNQRNLGRSPRREFDVYANGEFPF